LGLLADLKRGEKYVPSRDGRGRWKLKVKLLRSSTIKAFRLNRWGI